MSDPWTSKLAVKRTAPSDARADVPVNLQGHDPFAGGAAEEEIDLRHLERTIDGPKNNGHLVARFQHAHERSLAPRCEVLVLQGLRKPAPPAVRRRMRGYHGPREGR